MNKNITRRKKLLQIATSLSYIDPDDIPEIDLYMDQLTTFMEDKLNANKRSDDDKTMTKTMINNYTKNNLLPPPDKKRYSKDHLIMLLYIYYLKNFVSITDIQTLLAPMNNNDCYSGESPVNIEEVYRKLFNYEIDNYNDIIKSILSTYDKASDMYDPETDAYLHDMCMVSMLSVDVYVKKKCIEHLIDDMHSVQEQTLKKNEQKIKNTEKAKAAEKAGIVTVMLYYVVSGDTEEQLTDRFHAISQESDENRNIAPEEEKLSETDMIHDVIDGTDGRHG